MATIRKLQSGKWQSLVRRRGHPEQSKSFLNRPDAEKWARAIESELDRGLFLDRSTAESTTMADLIDRYLEEVTPLKRSAKNDRQRLLYLKRYFGCYSIAALQSRHVAAWRDRRLNDGKAGSTVVKELNSLSHLVDVAIKDWGIGLPFNPVKLVRKPRQAGGRDRRVTQEEMDALRNTPLEPIVILAVETGMRLGELLSLEWRAIDLQRRVASLALTKNGEKRDVPLSPSALAILDGMERKGQRVFCQWKASDSFKNAWKRTLLRIRKGNPDPCFLMDLRFHDLRHEAASRLFEKGFNMMEVATITGHKTLAMLRRYTHLKAEELALKLVTSGYPENSQIPHK